MTMMRIIRLARPASSGLVWRTETILCTDETNNNNNNNNALLV
jgi:hypothetical protein